MAKASTIARKLQEQQQFERIARVVRESIDNTDAGWDSIYSRGRASSTYSGGQSARTRPRALIRDRDEGRFYPFYEEENDLELMRNKCRDLATFTSISVGAMLALRCYTMGGEWNYEAVPKEDATELPSPELLREVNVIINANLQRNAWIGDYDGEIHDCSREDGEALIAGYATPDGLVDFRRNEVETLRAPANPSALNRWLEMSDRDCSWTFGVHTCVDDRMKRIDHERHAGYHCVFVDGGAHWDYLPAWPQAIGDPDLDGKFLHQIKRNVPRKAKRGISDYWPVLDDLERGKKLSVNLSVGAAVLAAIPWIETMPAGTTRDQAQSQLARAMDTFSRSLTQNRGNERNVLNLKPGTPLKVSAGREYTAGPMGQVRQPIYIEVHQHLSRAIGLRWLMPEYMISGDASNANYASTLVSESPFVKAREGDQQFYVSHFKLILLKSLKIACDAGRFRSYGVRDWGHLLSLIDLTIQPPMVASRDKAKQLEELRDLWGAGLIDGNEYRIDLKREPKPEYEGKSGGGPSPEEMQAALAQQAAGVPGAPGAPPQPPGPGQPLQGPPDDPNGQPAKQEPKPAPSGPKVDAGGTAGGPQVDRREATRESAFGQAIATATTIDEARAMGRAILEGRWVTLNGSGDEGGAKAYIEDDGTVSKGPAALAGGKVGKGGSETGNPKQAGKAGKESPKKTFDADKSAAQANAMHDKAMAGKGKPAAPKPNLGELEDAAIEAELAYDDAVESGDQSKIGPARDALAAANDAFEKASADGGDETAPAPEVKTPAVSAPGKAASGDARTFADDSEADEWGAEHFSKWEGQLDDMERRVINNYTGEDYTAINDSLRGGLDPANAAGRLGVAARTLDAAIAKAPPLAEPVRAFRGLSTHLNIKPGDTFTDRAFVSTSLNESVSSGAAFGGKSGAVVDILIPKGARGAYVDLLNDRGEQEFLLPRNAKFKIKAVKLDGKQQRIQAELIL